MGRTMKRVPIGFDWPSKKVWGGYINPYRSQACKCDLCDGSGYSQVARGLQDLWYGKAPFKPEDRGSKPLTVDTPEVRSFAERNVQNSPEYYGTDKDAVLREAGRLVKLWNAQWQHHLNADDVMALVKADRLWDFMRTPRTPEQKEIVRAKVAARGNSWLPEDNGYIPTPEEVNRWSLRGFGHDTINCCVVVKAECERLGYTGTCAKCGGKGQLWPSLAIEELAEKWMPTEPPVGDGYQLWETTSEGSPLSPVFHTLSELSDWCSGNATTFGDLRATAEEWLAMFNNGFVCHTEGNKVFM